MRGGRFGTFDKPAPQTIKKKSFGFIGPEGSTLYAMYPQDATPVQIAEAIAKEAGGQNWPMRIDGVPLEEYSFSRATDDIHDITWAPSKGTRYRE